MIYQTSMFEVTCFFHDFWSSYGNCQCEEYHAHQLIKLISPSLKKSTLITIELLLDLERLSYYEHIIHSHLNTCFFVRHDTWDNIRPRQGRVKGNWVICPCLPLPYTYLTMMAPPYLYFHLVGLHLPLHFTPLTSNSHFNGYNTL